MIKYLFFSSYLLFTILPITYSLHAQTTLTPFLTYPHWENDFISIDSIDFEKNPFLHERVFWLTYQTKFTPSGWKIDYWVKKDSSTAKDIYIRTMKGAFEKLYKGANLLFHRSYFIPIYLTETTDKIILDYGCATDCSAITFLPKTDTINSLEFRNLVSIDTINDHFIYVTDSSYQFENQLFQLGIVDFKNNCSTLLTLPCICSQPYKPSCVTQVTNTEAYIKIVTSLRNGWAASNAIPITSVIKLE